MLLGLLLPEDPSALPGFLVFCILRACLRISRTYIRPYLYAITLVCIYDVAEDITTASHHQRQQHNQHHRPQRQSDHHIFISTQPSSTEHFRVSLHSIPTSARTCKPVRIDSVDQAYGGHAAPWQPASSEFRIQRTRTVGSTKQIQPPACLPTCLSCKSQAKAFQHERPATP